VAGAGCDSGGDPYHFRPVSVGRGEATTVYEVAQYAAINLQIPVVAAGVRNTSQALIALGLGASGVVLREPLAGTDEAPYGGGASPAYHHSNTLSAQVAVRKLAQRSSDRMATVSRTVATAVPNKGSVKAYMLYLLSGLRSGMRDLGFGSLQALHDGLENESLRMECRLSFSSQYRESCSQMAKMANHPEVMPVSLSASAR
jgi:IMP dehydrogenase